MKHAIIIFILAIQDPLFTQSQPSTLVTRDTFTEKSEMWPLQPLGAMGGVDTPDGAPPMYNVSWQKGYTDIATMALYGESKTAINPVDPVVAVPVITPRPGRTTTSPHGAHPNS